MLVVSTKAQQQLSPGTQLFCPAHDTPVTLDEMVSLVRAEARHQQATAETLVQELILDGLRRRYPCD